MARFSQVGGARARWPSSPPDYGDPSQPILFPEGWAFEVRSIKPRTGGFLGRHMGTVGGWHHSVAVAVSVSRRQAGLSISSQLTGNMALLLPVRPAGKQLRQFSSPTCGSSEVGAGYVLRHAAPSAAGRTEAGHHHRVCNSLYRQGLSRNYTFGRGTRICCCAPRRRTPTYACQRSPAEPTGSVLRRPARGRSDE